MFRNPTTDILLVLLFVLLIFGPKRLPTMGRELGRGIREFKDSITTSSKDSHAEEDKKAELAAASGDAAGAAQERPGSASATGGERSGP